MTYFFDLDGTLLDHSAAQDRGLEALANFSPEYRKCLDTDFRPTWQSAEDRHFARYERKEISMEEHRRERLRECFPEVCREMSDEALDHLYGVYRKGYQEGFTLYSDTLDVLNQLQGPKALITNGDGRMQRAKIAALKLEGYFSAIIISGEVGHAKPSKEIFEIACNTLQVKPAEVTFIGDSFEKDVQGSANAGLKPIWLNRDGAPAPAADFSFDQIVSLRQLVIPRKDQS